ncbi:hypothetical protein, partial [Streptomyces sp. NPDC006510]|uniref:hypothetical protein n=1 Tax=Streptomyces sp. NPDC006510 TaxID=3155600 RepID=UPI0033B465D6
MTADQHDVPADLTAIEAALGRMVYRAGTLETARGISGAGAVPAATSVTYAQVAVSRASAFRSA